MIKFINFSKYYKKIKILFIKFSPAVSLCILSYFAKNYINYLNLVV